MARDTAAVENFANTVAETAERVRTPMEEVTAKVKELSESATGLLMQVGSSLQSAFTAMLSGEGVIESLGRAIRDLIKRLIAAAAAAAIVSAIISSLTGVPFKATFGSVFGGFSGIGGGMPMGGSPMPAGMGNLGISGAMRNDNINLSGQFRIDGQDLVVAVERANNQRSNFTG